MRNLVKLFTFAASFVGMTLNILQFFVENENRLYIQIPLTLIVMFQVGILYIYYREYKTIVIRSAYEYMRKISPQLTSSFLFIDAEPILNRIFFVDGAGMVKIVIGIMWFCSFMPITILILAKPSIVHTVGKILLFCTALAITGLVFRASAVVESAKIAAKRLRENKS